MSSITPTKTTLDGKPARGSRWRARYRDPSGRTRSKTFERRVDAQQFLDVTSTDKHRGEFTDPALRRSRFEDWAESWWAMNEARFRVSTRSTSRRVLDNAILPTFSGRRIGEIDRAEVKAWVAEMLGQGSAPKTVRNRVAIVKSIFDEAIEGRALRDNPAAGIRIPRARASEPHFLTAEQVEALAEAIEPPYAFLVRFAAYSGLRPAEVAGVRVRRLDLLAGRVDVVETLTTVAGSVVSGPTKTSARRTVTVPRFLCEEACEYFGWLESKLGRKLKPDDLVFRSPSGSPLNTDNWRRRVMVPALERVGLPVEVRFYDLRHSCASLMIALGAHPRLVMERLGHSDISTTMNVYGHIWPALHEQLNDQLEDLHRTVKGKPWKAPIASVDQLPRRTSA